MEIKSIEVSSTMGGVIPDAPYANERVSFTETIHADLASSDNESEIRKELRDKLHTDLYKKFEEVSSVFKANAIEQQFRNMRFYTIDGMKYPSVTTITGWDKDFKISKIDLMQYASRGTLVHALIHNYFETGKWLTIQELVEKEPELRADAIILHDGLLGLTVDQCSHVAFFEKYKDDFEMESFEQVVSNKKYKYAGRYDAIGIYKGKKSLIDFKSGQGEFKQLAAYAKADEINVDQLVICPVGKTDNKQGYIAPRVEVNIQKHFEEFLEDRAKFTERFGI